MACIRSLTTAARGVMGTACGTTRTVVHSTQLRSRIGRTPGPCAAPRPTGAMCGVARRRISTAHLGGCRARKTPDRNSRHYKGKGSATAWQNAERAAATVKPARKGTAVWIVLGCGVILVGSVGVMGLNVFGWSKARGRDSLKVANTPLIDGNPIVYMDLEADEMPVGRVVIQLRSDLVPITAENFRLLITEELGYGLQVTRFHCVTKPDALYGGDYMSATAGLFRDENFELKHDGPGVLTMVNEGAPHTNGSRFAITLRAAPELDGKQVAFGNVVEGMDVLWEVVRSQNKFAGSIQSGWAFAKPVPVQLVIKRCGQLGWVGDGVPPRPKLPPLRGELPPEMPSDVLAEAQRFIKEEEERAVQARLEQDATARADSAAHSAERPN